MSDTEVQTEAPRITVVDNTNFEAFVDEKLGVVPKTPEEQAAEELAAIEDKRAAEEDVTHDVPEVPKDKKSKLNERFSELTAARKAAEEKAERALASERTARETADALQAERDALKNKYEPPKPDVILPEPLPSQFTDVNEYAKALKDWTVDITRRFDAKQAADAQASQEREQTTKTWMSRQEDAKKEIADYEEKIKSSPVKVSDLIRDAIVESDVGPQVLYHLANHPEFADKLAEMRGDRALRELGKLEATFVGTEKPAPTAKVAEISRAPAPISPLKGASVPVTTLRGSDAVPATMTYDQWKALRVAGKIK